MLLLISFCSVSFGESGLTGTAGQYIDVLGNQAAVANRKISDQLLQDALKHEAQGWSTLNVPLIVQSLQESLDGVKANNQSRELGRSTLGAIDSGKLGGHLNEKNHGKMSQSDFNKFSNSSSRFLPTVKGKLDGWGIKVSYDNKKVTGAYGDYNVNDLNASVIQKIVEDKAAALGLGSIVTKEKIQQGIQQALNNRKKIAKKIMAETKKRLAAKGLEKLKRRKVAKTRQKKAAAKPTIAAAGSKKESQSDGSMDDQEKRFRELFPDFKEGPEAHDPEDLRKAQLAAQKHLEQYKNLTESRLGIDPKVRLGRADQNIFKMVHTRYQVKRYEKQVDESLTKRSIVTIAESR